MRNLAKILTLLLLIATLAVADVTLQPQGVSPTMVKFDSLGVYTRVYSGLLNAGVGTQMVLKGSSDTTLAAPTWTVSQAPGGSAAAIGTTANVDDMTQLATFIPDVMGTYVVDFADGGMSASVTINAATYTGIQAGACANCHQDQAADWAMTGHSTKLVDAMNGTDRSGTSCLPCHTVGFDSLTANGGFDDFPFEYPGSTGPGVADSVTAVYPQAMKLANIQCESCHGPGSSHYGNTADSKMVASLDVGACAQCHDDDHYHVYPSQWEASAHSDPPSRASWSGGCARCHTPEGFIEFTDGEAVQSHGTSALSCAACHDPHSVEHEDQLRTSEAVLLNGVEVTNAGRGTLCMNCHQARRDANSYTEKAGSHFGPHYAPQADMLMATNAVTFGKKLPTSPHLEATENACVDCHMYEIEGHGEHDAEGNLNTSGMHSFSMVNKQGVDNVAACADCHGNVGETFAEKKFFMSGKADHDGDGDAEGLQEEVHGLMDTLAGLLPSDDTHADPDSTWTKTELKAAYNHRLVYYDHSYGIHNPAFIVSLLQVSIQALINNAIDGEIVAIDDVPNDQGKKVRIIWDKMADDGVSVDPVKRYIVKRLDEDKEVWVNVGDVLADGSMRYALVVPTVYDSTDMGPGLTTFMVSALTQSGLSHKSMPAEGYSIDNLVPMAPAGFMATLAGNEVMMTWEEPQDVDFNYFAIYRSTEAGFVPTEETQIATTTGIEFVDADLEENNTYYYKIAAYDFSGNESEFAEADPVIVSGVNGRGNAVPTEFSIAQNYPNPFNPTTIIEFAVPHADDVKVRVYDIRGVHVRTLAQGNFAAGYHSLSWDGRDDSGNLVSAGTYLYRLESKTTSFTKKAIFLK